MYSGVLFFSPYLDNGLWTVRCCEVNLIFQIDYILCQVLFLVRGNKLVEPPYGQRHAALRRNGGGSHRIRQDRPWIVAKAVRLSSRIFSLFENKRNETMQVVSLARHAGATTSCYHTIRVRSSSIERGKERKRERENESAKEPWISNIYERASSHFTCCIGLRKYSTYFHIACCIRKAFLWKAFVPSWATPTEALTNCFRATEWVIVSSCSIVVLSDVVCAYILLWASERLPERFPWLRCSRQAHSLTFHDL